MFYFIIHFFFVFWVGDIEMKLNPIWQQDIHFAAIFEQLNA